MEFSEVANMTLRRDFFVPSWALKRKLPLISVCFKGYLHPGEDGQFFLGKRGVTFGIVSSTKAGTPFLTKTTKNGRRTSGLRVHHLKVKSKYTINDQGKPEKENGKDSANL